MTAIKPPPRAPLAEIARWYGLNYARLFAEVRSGRLPHENHGTDIRPRYWIRTEDIETYIKERSA